MVEGEGFEPSKTESADLQSAPFDRSGTPPRCQQFELNIKSSSKNDDMLHDLIFYCNNKF